MLTSVPPGDRIRRPLLAALALLAASCRDDDIADDPILPDNVDASVEECDVGDGAPLAVVEVTNGTGHATRFEVTVAFVGAELVRESVVATSDEVDPGGVAVLRFEGAADTDAVDDCRIEDVVDLSG